MIVLAFLESKNSYYFGTTLLLMRKDALKQLRQQAKEGPYLVRTLPPDQSILVNYIKSKFQDLSRDRKI